MVWAGTYVTAEGATVTIGSDRFMNGCETEVRLSEDQVSRESYNFASAPDPIVTDVRKFVKGTVTGEMDTLVAQGTTVKIETVDFMANGVTEVRLSEDVDVRETFNFDTTPTPKITSVRKKVKGTITGELNNGTAPTTPGSGAVTLAIAKSGVFTFSGQVKIKPVDVQLGAKPDDVAICSFQFETVDQNYTLTGNATGDQPLPVASVTPVALEIVATGLWFSGNVRIHPVSISLGAKPDDVGQVSFEFETSDEVYEYGAAEPQA